MGGGDDRLSLFCSNADCYMEKDKHGRCLIAGGRNVPVCEWALHPFLRNSFDFLLSPAMSSLVQSRPL